MNAPFPFGFPLPTAWYLTLYVATLLIHVLFMNYVLAGTGWLAVGRTIRPGDDQARPLRVILEDWLPFFLGAAITAGVAPLLFIQILYKQPFYTANLLLFHRWMAIVPVLIIGFYLLYLLKSKQLARRPAWLRLSIGLAAFMCFAFIAYSWTENHLLSLQDPESWGAFYGERRLKHFEAALLPRLGIWFIGSIPTMLVILLWQLWFQHTRRLTPNPLWTEAIVSREARQAALGALLGLAGAGLAALGYLAVAPDAVLGGTLSWMAAPYAAIALVGLGIQGTGWWRMWTSGRLTARRLAVISVGVLLTVLGMTVIREAIRLTAVDISALHNLHAEAARVGGLSVFLLFFVINGLLVAWVFVLAKRGLGAKAESTSIETDDGMGRA